MATASKKVNIAKALQTQTLPAVHMSPEDPPNREKTPKPILANLSKIVNFWEKALFLTFPENHFSMVKIGFRGHGSQ